MVCRIVSGESSKPGGPRHEARRQSGGARKEASDRVRFFGESSEVEGWTLNLSRGGVRVVVEDSLELGKEYEISIGEDDQVRRPCRVVWLRQEADGQIAGVQFLDTNTGTIPPMPTDPPGSGAAG